MKSNFLCYKISATLTDIRHFMLKSLMSESEKHLLKRAIDDRVERLHKIAKEERTADSANNQKDCLELYQLGKLCSTNEWG